MVKVPINNKLINEKSDLSQKIHVVAHETL